jgi:DNA-binding CsgD family transcriptional regulator
LQAGDIEAAKAYENELKQFNLEAINVKNMGTFESRFQHAFVSAKILYAEGHYQGAYDLIEPYAVLAETHERWRFVVRLRTFQAKCFFALNLNWMELIEGVWGVAQKQDMLRSILDEGQDCLSMIKTIDADSCRQIGISMNFLSLLQDALLREVLPGKSDSSAKDRKIKNSLTLTELEIVKLLAKGLANKQIATLLGIGTGTVKWHLHNIYIKLDAPSRRSAVTIAHQSGLLA